VAVTDKDVRHIAELARLGMSDARIPSLVAELNRILEHMDVLSKVDTKKAIPAVGVGSGGMVLREDVGLQLPLERPREMFAPSMQDQFFIVPRLSTHEDPDPVADDAGEDVVSPELIDMAKREEKERPPEKSDPGEGKK
jgi:aspartyl-tRNA(Asn)/glutamyl-tRNA(Gln) amidotransferase subunit C